MMTYTVAIKLKKKKIGKRVISPLILLLKNKVGTEMGVLWMENYKIWQKNEVTRDYKSPSYQSSQLHVWV